MTKARTIAELHYPNKAGNRFDEKHRQSRINALEKLITKQLTLTDVVKSDSEQFTPNDVKLPKENKPISMHTDSKKPLNKKV